jgi:hypothetical protein
LRLAAIGSICGDGRKGGSKSGSESQKVSTVAHKDTAGKGVADDELSDARQDKEEASKEVIGTTVSYKQMHDCELSRQG